MNKVARSPAPNRGRAPQTESGVTSYTSYINREAWTPARVAQRLRKAAALRERLTGCDTEYAAAGDSIGIIGVADVGGTRDAVVAEAAEALSWLSWLDPDDAGIVLARLDGSPWKAICWRYGISRPTADRHWRYAMALIAWRLNGDARTDRAPSLRSLLGLRQPAAGEAP